MLISSRIFFWRFYYGKKYYKIEDVSIKTGLTKRAIRYYEDLNLISPKRTESGYRLYTDEDIEKIQKIISLKDSLGFSLSEIKAALELDKNVKNILSGETADTETIDNYAKLIEKQIDLIEEKSRKLLMAKQKFEELLLNLSKLKQKSKEAD
ncbi:MULTISPECIES: MerR family transcriptional regulator [Thermoanaerobacterium]|uniref:MerR family transcriptional regulator n=2 Tax=Thermoanaerobacterium TaxID=28895 RepID=W9E8W4_9THEO|nr:MULTISPECIES: MerR family transcriptional regulator [Thermoanaerobacterium]AFK86647.1 transcriptional regulator, MerR family [Thermoanaerobacterium saccharolyticum JW/SL-YS485]ETO38338.1 MerR family transcriptional regulator [Thermoanaerobacterium aotearoense SCUT27]